MSTFGDKLKQLRMAAGLTQDELAKKCGITKQNISRYENSSREPNIRTAKVIADAFGVPLADFAPETSKETAKKDDMLRTPEETRLVRLWRLADQHDRKTVMTVLSRYEAVEDPLPPVRLIRHYLVPAAAGYASPIEGEEYEEIPLPADAPQDADFCIDIQGDSMEPYIHDGQRVFIKRGAPLQKFEPGVFFVDGDVYCKQFCPGYAGQVYLLSANPKRQDANITITRDGGRNCVYFGKVLLGKKLPKPEYER